MLRQVLRHPGQAIRSAYVAFFQLPWLPEAALGSFNFAGLRTLMKATAKSNTFEAGAFDHYTEAWTRPGRLTGMLNYYRALRQRPAQQETARVQPKTLILWASGDCALNRHVAEAGLALCDDGELEIIEDASHWLHLEQPELINKRVVEFLHVVD